MVANTTAEDREQTANKLDADFDEYEAEIRNANEVMYEDDEVVVLVDSSLNGLTEMANTLSIDHTVAQNVMDNRIDALTRTLEQHTDNLWELRTNTQILVFNK
ncbi:hypothetical protein [Haloarcula sp. CGMCC 1.6347]|uniref:hypothetical protein n=1 Tax=Haloarcula sp. CGMCC 1.6347 TaxID=3111455 RepID=UPI00300F27E0